MNDILKVGSLNLQRPLDIILKADNGHQVRMYRMDQIQHLGTYQISKKVNDSYFMINAHIPNHSLTYPKWNEIMKVIKGENQKVKEEEIEILASGFAPTIGVVFVVNLKKHLPFESFVAIDEYQIITWCHLPKKALE